MADSERSRAAAAQDASRWLDAAPARAKVWPVVFVASVAVTCALGLLLCLDAPTSGPVRVEVDLFTSARTNIELFLNDLTRPPRAQRLTPGERRRYVFEGITEDITLLRLDPTDAGNAVIDIYSIVVSAREGVVARFGSQALAGWSSSALTTIGVDGAALHLRSTTSDPILATSPRIPVSKGGMWDNFHPVVRVPLVFAEVVDRYVPFDSLGRVDLLRRREGSERPALSYWRDTLGADVNVGKLASVSSFEHSGTCQGQCADLLEVHVVADGERPIQVPVRVADLSFSLTLTRIRRETVYRVLLDHVWFWRVAQRSNLPRSVGEPPIEGVRPTLRSVRMIDGVLY